MQSYLFACNNTGAVHFLKQIKVDGEFPINIHELWLKSEKISPLASQNNNWKKTCIGQYKITCQLLQTRRLFPYALMNGKYGEAKHAEPSAVNISAVLYHSILSMNVS